MQTATHVLRGMMLTGAVVVAAACNDDEDGRTGPGEDVYGVWELTSEDEDLFLHIEAERITIYDRDSVSDCYESSFAEVVDREGEVFTLSLGGEEIVAQITRDGDDLVIDSEGETARYGWADINPATLDVC